MHFNNNALQNWKYGSSEYKQHLGTFWGATEFKIPAARSHINQKALSMRTSKVQHRVKEMKEREENK